MARVKKWTIDESTMNELEDLIEQKLLELLGDPDSGLELKPEFRKKLKMRLKKASPRTSHQEVMKRFA